MNTAKIAIFKGKQIRKTLHNDEWWFSIIDVVEVLAETDRPRKYWSDLKKKLIEEGYSEVSEKIGQLKLQAPDGKMRLTDCADTETLFRIIQSIPSPKAEPFKRWLAKVGFELIFTMLGERSTTEIHRIEDTKGMQKLQSDANRGGKIAGVARKELEKELGRSVVAKSNYLPKKKRQKSLQ